MSTLRVMTSMVLLALASANGSGACSCADLTLEQEVELSDAIFVGQVIKLEVVGSHHGTDEILATVEVSEVLKGAPGIEVEFRTDNGCCYCSPAFTIAEVYLFFAGEADGRFATSLCSRTRPLSEASDLLRDLGFAHLIEPDPAPPSAPGEPLDGSAPIDR